MYLSIPATSILLLSASYRKLFLFIFALFLLFLSKINHICSFISLSIYKKCILLYALFHTCPLHLKLYPEIAPYWFIEIYHIPF